MTKCAVVSAWKRSAGSKRLAASVRLAQTTSRRTLIRDRRANAFDIFEEPKIGRWGQVNAGHGPLNDSKVGFVPQADVWLEIGQPLLDQSVESSPLSLVARCGRFVEQRIDPRIAEVSAIE